MAEPETEAGIAIVGGVDVRHTEPIPMDGDLVGDLGQRKLTLGEDGTTSQQQEGFRRFRSQAAMLRRDALAVGDDLSDELELGDLGFPGLHLAGPGVDVAAPAVGQHELADVGPRAAVEDRLANR